MKPTKQPLKFAAILTKYFKPVSHLFQKINFILKDVAINLQVVLKQSLNVPLLHISMLHAGSQCQNRLPLNVSVLSEF